MWTITTGVLPIAVGLLCVLTRKDAARGALDYQQHMFPKMRPYDARTLRRTETIYAIVGLGFILLGTLRLLGVLAR